MGNEEIYLDRYDDGYIPIMRILVEEDVHIPGKSENAIMARLDGKPGALSAHLI